MLSLVSAAFAIAAFDTGSGCAFGGETLFSVPTPGATNVPVDVYPAFVYTESTCGETLAALVLSTDRGRTLATETVDVSEGLGELPLDSALATDTSFVFTTSTDRAEATVGFTTGSGTSVAAGIVPTVESVEATWVEETSELELRAEVSYSGGAGADLIAQWIDGPESDPTGSTFTRIGAAGLDDSASWVSRLSRSQAPESWCVRGRTRELDGSWTEGEPTCAAVVTDSVCGCASSPAPLAAFAAVLGGLAALRRRSG